MTIRNHITGWLPEVERIEARWWGPPRRLDAVDTIVIHRFDKGSGEAGIRYAQEPGDRKVSWHFSICEDGRVVQHVPLDVTAWHAGPGRNSYSLGIEHASGPLGMREPWTEECIEASVQLCLELVGLCPRARLVRHSDLTPARKDPGPLWPAERYTAAGLVVR